MIKIRNSVFETNSSSTHSICISNEKFIEDLPSYVKFSLGNFGWEENRLDTINEKASYLYTAICELEQYHVISKSECINFIVKVFNKNNIQYDFEEPTKDPWWYGIDHVSEDDMIDFVKLVCHSEKRLLKYLFSEKSFILTGNDNDDSNVSINVTYKHEEYYKGN